MEVASIYDILGYAGSFLIGTMLIPQVYRTLTTKKTDDLSTIFIVLHMVAVGCMIPYSIHYKLYPVLFANISVGSCNGIILIQIIINTKKK